MINLNFLPQRIQNALRDVDLGDFSEIRLRTGFAVFAIKNGQKMYFKENGLTLNRFEAMTCYDSDVKETILNLTERSLYAFNEKLKQGFLTTKDGVRVGICGECVFDNDKIITIKKFSSLNIRIPHEIKNCSQKIYDNVFSKQIFNTLIISPPSKGKTTILKDLARKINENTDKSILIIDERGEFGNVVGENIDCIKYSDKVYALNIGIRSMSPNIVITDELQTENDWKSVEHAATDGVKVIASCHGKSINDLKNKPYFNKNVFERYIVLDSDKPAGTVNEIVDMDFNAI